MSHSLHSQWILVIALTAAVTASSKEPQNLPEALGELRNEASTARFRARERADFEYRKAVVSTFKFADRVEVYLLDHTLGRDSKAVPLADEEAFPIRPYNTSTRILKRRSADRGQIRDWCSLIGKAITTTDPVASVFCHHPIYGVRVFGEDTLLFETSFCWMCGNYYFEYDGGPQWEGLNLDAADLKEALEEFLPPVPLANFPK